MVADVPQPTLTIWIVLFVAATFNFTLLAVAWIRIRANRTVLGYSLRHAFAGIAVFAGSFSLGAGDGLHPPAGSVLCTTQSLLAMGSIQYVLGWTCAIVLMIFRISAHDKLVSKAYFRRLYIRFRFAVALSACIGIAAPFLEPVPTYLRCVPSSPFLLAGLIQYLPCLISGGLAICVGISLIWRGRSTMWSRASKATALKLHGVSSRRISTRSSVSKSSKQSSTSSRRASSIADSCGFPPSFAGLSTINTAAPSNILGSFESDRVYNAFQFSEQDMPCSNAPALSPRQSASPVSHHDGDTFDNDISDLGRTQPPPSIANFKTVSISSGPHVSISNECTSSTSIVKRPGIDIPQFSEEQSEVVWFRNSMGKTRSVSETLPERYFCIATDASTTIPSDLIHPHAVEHTLATTGSVSPVSAGRNSQDMDPTALTQSSFPQPTGISLRACTSRSDERVCQSGRAYVGRSMNRLTISGGAAPMTTDENSSLRTEREAYSYVSEHSMRDLCETEADTVKSPMAWTDDTTHMNSSPYVHNQSQTIKTIPCANNSACMYLSHTSEMISEMRTQTCKNEVSTTNKSTKKGNGFVPYGSDRCSKISTISELFTKNSLGERSKCTQCSKRNCNQVSVCSTPGNKLTPPPSATSNIVHPGPLRRCSYELPDSDVHHFGRTGVRRIVHTYTSTSENEENKGCRGSFRSSLHSCNAKYAQCCWSLQSAMINPRVVTFALLLGILALVNGASGLYYVLAYDTFEKAQDAGLTSLFTSQDALGWWLCVGINFVACIFYRHKSMTVFRQKLAQKLCNRQQPSPAVKRIAQPRNRHFQTRPRHVVRARKSWPPTTRREFNPSLK